MKMTMYKYSFFHLGPEQELRISKIAGHRKIHLLMLQPKQTGDHRRHPGSFNLATMQQVRVRHPADRLDKGEQRRG